MRFALPIAVAVLLAGCGSSNHHSGLLSSTLRITPGPPRAGGAPSLTQHGRSVVGKGLIVLRTHGDDVVVRNPRGGTLTLTHRHPAGATATERPGDEVSFVGLRTGTTVQVSRLTVVASR